MDEHVRLDKTKKEECVKKKVRLALSVKKK